MRPPTGNRISQGQHGSSKAVDYSASPDPYIYAPEDLTFDSYMQRGSGTSDAGLALRARGAHGLHQFAHTEETYFTGGTVKKGQRIAKMGYTGYTIPSGPNGRHLHWWIQTPNGYVYPPSLITEPFGGSQPQGGDNPMPTRQEIIDEYLVNRGAPPSEEEIQHHLKGTWKSMSLGFKGENDNNRAAAANRIRELETALAQKPKEVIKEVVKEVPVKDPAQEEEIRALKQANKTLSDEAGRLKEALLEKPKEVEKKIVVDPTYYPAGDLFRALLQKALAWFNKK